jgi:uncharacterized membrane protein YkgB
VIIFLWFGGMKFTSYEASGIAAFITHSPLMSWLKHSGVRGTSRRHRHRGVRNGSGAHCRNSQFLRIRTRGGDVQFDWERQRAATAVAQSDG